MTDKRLQDADPGNMKKDPDDWVTGDELMTGAQRSYLKTLSEEAKQPFDAGLTKAQASRRIEELQALTGRSPPDRAPDERSAEVPRDRPRGRAPEITPDNTRQSTPQSTPEAPPRRGAATPSTDPNPGVPMPQVADVMTRGVRSMAPTDNLQLAAQAMDELNVGAIPVCDGDRVIGMVTDRDITVRGVAQGLPVEKTPLSAVMSANVECVHEADDLEDVTVKMQMAQIRRLPVLDAQGKLVGIVSLGDMATKGDIDDAGDTLADVSEPSEPDRSASSAASSAAGGGSASGAPSSRRP